MKKRKWNTTEQVLLWFALALCALIVCYNLFFTKDFSSSSIVLTTQSSDVSVSDEMSAVPSAADGVEAVVKPAATDKLDLNEATASELAALLPGVGEVLAARIVEYREGKGGFTKIDELLEVNGIGNATFEAIRDYITVSGDVSE